MDYLVSIHNCSSQGLRAGLRPEDWLDKRYELKQQREVTAATGAGRSGPPAAARPPPPATSKTEPPAEGSSDPDPALAPLDPATIQQLHDTIRSLPRPRLEGFSMAFRKRFQVPADAPSIADRICQQQHHDRIETFLVPHQLQPGRAAQPLS